MKKWIAVLTAAAMGAAILSGCGSSQTEGAGAETEASTSGTEVSTSGTEAGAAGETEEAAESVSEESGSEDAGQEESKSAENTSGLDKLVFTYVTAPLNVPSIVERDQGIFGDAFGDMGIDVEYAEITSGADQTQALASGDVQVLYAVGSSSVILSAANGADIKVINMYSRSPGAFCMYTKDESLTTPESLAGKTIAGPVGTNLHELLAAYLASADMTIDDVNYVNMSIPDAMAGLEGGSLDVALLAGATAYQAEQSGYHMIADGEGLIDADIAVAVTGEFYEEHPEIIEKLEEAQEAVIDFMDSNPDETMEIVAEALDLDVTAVEDMYADYDFSLEVTDKDREGFQKTADFMLEADMIENEMDTDTLFAAE